MKYLSRKETKVITYKSAAQFEAELNHALKGLAEEGLATDVRYIEHPTLIAIVTYEREEARAESLEDAYNLEGIRARCRECARFSERGDKRLCRGYCSYLGEMVRKDAHACERHYKDLELEQMRAG